MHTCDGMGCSVRSLGAVRHQLGVFAEACRLQAGCCTKTQH
jgi:hypothetical protein